MTQKITLTCLFLLIFSYSFSQTKTLIGKWENTDADSNKEIYEFNTDQTAFMTKNGEKSPPFSYIYDINKNPNWIDLTVAAEDFQMTMLGLIEFIDDNTVKLELFPDDGLAHPKVFSKNTSTDDITSVILKRI